MPQFPYLWKILKLIVREIMRLNEIMVKCLAQKLGTLLDPYLVVSSIFIDKKYFSQWSKSHFLVRRTMLCAQFIGKEVKVSVAFSHCYTAMENLSWLIKNGQFSRTNYFRIKKGRDDSPVPSPWIRRTHWLMVFSERPIRCGGDKITWWVQLMGDTRVASRLKEPDLHWFHLW